MKKTKENVYKENKLVEAHCQYMNAIEYKLLYVGLSKIMIKEFTLNKFNSIIVEFTVKEFCSLMEINKVGAYSNIKKKTDSLMKRLIVFEDLDKPESDWEKYQWVISFIYSNGKVKLGYSPHITKHIKYSKEKRGFTLYPLNVILRMKSYYSIRLYELLFQYKRIGNRKISIYKLKSLLGIPFTKYKEYKYFKRKILLPCTKEINLVSNLQVDLTEIKKARKVVEVNFRINKNLNFKEDYNTNYENLPKIYLFDFVKNLYHEKTGYVIQYKKVQKYHRIILLEIIRKLEQGDFNSVNIKYPDTYLQGVFKKELERIKKIKDLTKIEDF